MLYGYDALILVDALGRGEAPGTVTVLEPDLGDDLGSSIVDAHGMHPGAVLSMVSDIGGHLGRVLVVGCEPETLEEHIGLSPVVEGVVDRSRPGGQRSGTSDVGAEMERKKHDDS